ncbi:MAG: gliding motility-associated C-terminal domain-containing protein, partial [Muribaculaceae bacterium]|nr:gliding motility-associated C-terminal domain-containing protein [Muribaculaceae bacterium]
DGRRTCVWVVNYANHELYLGSLSAAPEQECGSALLEFSGAAGEIPYYTINGRRMELSRDLNLEYTTLAFDEANFTFSPSTTVETVPHIGATVAVTAPLCDTSFRLSGDRFLEKWNRGQSIVSPSFQTRSIDIRTRATQTARDNDNEQRPETEGLGGSAPCEIEFEAAVSDAAVFTEWQISRTPDFDILENSYNELTLTYTFRENGNTYVRFVANNADGTCEQASDVYTVFVGESRLEIPNAFSPEGSPGINDEWKVSYRSLVSYRCHIFNRWGKELFSSTDPAVGWNGKIGNKTVPAGVYFYVIEAVGSDGIRYKRSGDINVINYTSESQPAE